MNFQSDRLSHAYITDETFVDTLAKAVVCSTRTGSRPCNKCNHCDKASRNIHPDITKVGKLDDKTIVTVDQIRDLKKDVYIMPNEATQKTYIVNDADSMNTNAQNAFLQILEEPPPHAVFILCSENPATLLPTIRSRCIELRSQMYKKQNETIEPEEENEELEELITDFLTSLSGDNIKLMESMFRMEKLDRIAFSKFLVLTRERIINSIKTNQTPEKSDINAILANAENIIRKADEMNDLNVSPSHIAGFICAELL